MNNIIIEVNPSEIHYDDFYNNPAWRRYNEVTIGAKDWLPDHIKEKIREELVENDGYYNQTWNEILRNFRMDESFIREILEYIGLEFLRQYQNDLTEDFLRELEIVELVRW